MNRFKRSIVHIQDRSNFSTSVSSEVTNPSFPCKIAVKCGSGTIYAHAGPQSPLIPLDLWPALADTSSNTPVPPIPLVGEAHLGWVFLCADGKLSPSLRRGRHE